MDEPLQRRLHDLTLSARHLLVQEAQELLEGVYGLQPDGRFEPADRLPALSALPEAMDTRRHLEKFLADERRAGMSADRAYDKLVKEIAFTHLNRLVAFKMMEARRLIRGTIDRYHDSNAFKFCLADHPEDLARYEAGDLPQDALGEGPRDAAYRHFLLSQSAQLSQDVKVLFDPDNLPSRLFPRPRALRELVAMLNSIPDAWQSGDEESTGWIYQYFNEPDLLPLRASSAKIPAHLVAAKSQQYTPRWIVRYLVHNTLGRHWVQMHPDSHLAQSLDYLVPIAGEIPPVPLKPVKAITLLDPACGTMHFGLVAFDLFAEMYREEIANAGHPCWPAKPSIEREEDIPAAIIAHNLFGIDIDLRAVQLSALTLYLKARSVNPSAQITASNLACADVLLLNGERLDAFIRQARFTRPIYERLLRALWVRLRDAFMAGSLVRVEAEVRDLVAQERKRYEKEGRQPDLFGISATRFEEEAAAEEYWSILEAQIIQAFDEFARQQAREGVDEAYFVGEVTKGFRLLDLMLRRYDVVVTNPPYLDSRDYSPELKKFMETTYSRTKRNLYAAFLERCLNFLNPQGRVGIVTPQTFMFISSFENLREILITRTAIENLVHTGLNTFPDAVVDCALYVLRQEGQPTRRSGSIGTYFRLVRAPSFDGKRLSFEHALALLSQRVDTDNVYHYRQGGFDAIAGSPWVYWITPGIEALFRLYPKLAGIAPPRMGMGTRNNDRFLRYWWELGTLRVRFACQSVAESVSTAKRWFPYMKGGKFRRWYGNQDYAVNFFNAGIELKEEQLQKYPYIGDNTGWIVPNEEYYFRPGVTWTDLTSSRFSARLSPGGFAFDVSGSSVFPENIPFVLGMMNSTFAQYALKLINPTVHVQVGDLARLPIPTHSSTALESLVDQAISLAKANSAEDETAYDFVAPPSWTRGLAELGARKAQLASIEREIDEDVYRLYGIGPEDRAAIEAELAEPVLAAVSDDSEPAEQPEEQEQAAPLTRVELARRWVSYAVGIVLGRFQPGGEVGLGCGSFPLAVAAALRSLADGGGIVPLDPGHPDDLAARVERALTLMLGEDETANLVGAIGGAAHQVEASLRRCLGGDFFKWHLQLHRKRPVYWLLQSPKRSYSLYLFHERITKDTLFLLQGNRHLGGKINQTQQLLSELQSRARAAEGTERRRIEREMEAVNTLLNELEQFAASLKAVTDARNERGEVVGWAPELDDGVILNLAPLHALVPSWSAEPRKYWERMEAGDCDWSFTAMRYWPDRVTAKCRTNKSYAIAHNLVSLYEGGAR